MNSGPVIALFGISGVGKSHLARMIVRARPNLLRLTASALLKSTFHTTGEKLRTASMSEVINNQFALANALSNARAGCRQRPVLLEAHAIIDNDREIVDVPFETIEPLGVAGILSLQAPLAEIETRRKRDRRKRPTRPITELERQQNRSIEATRRFASTLNVPFKMIDPKNVEAALQLIDMVCNQTKFEWL